MKREYKEIFIISIFTAFMGQVYYFPFGTDFRITFGVITFLFLVLNFKNVPILTASVFSAFSVFFLRGGIDLFHGEFSILEIVYRHFPAFMYYICYGTIIEKLDVREHTDKPVLFILRLSSADIAANMVELFIRRHYTVIPTDSVISTIFLAAFLRGFISMGIYWTVRYFNMIIDKEIHQNRYMDLIMLSTKLKSEIIFLKKSMIDMENAMEKSYSIYNTMKEIDRGYSDEVKEIAEKSLSLAIDIHEIKKDYYRLSASMEKLLPAQDTSKSMSISEIFNIINDIYSKFPEVIEKRIELLFEFNENFDTDQYLIVLSVLNNLIQNSIEAADKRSPFIKIRCNTIGDKVYLKVTDNGKGIPAKERETIFEPGFTTKFDPETGNGSTGLGLAHVRMLLGLLDGSINLNGSKTNLTEFILEIPRNNLIMEDI